MAERSSQSLHETDPATANKETVKQVFDISIFQDTMMEISVTGCSHESHDSTTVIRIHKALLQSKSPYFRAMQNFKENREDKVELQNMCPAAFDLFAYWVYHGNIPDIPSTKDVYVLIGAYVVGDRLMVSKFRDSILDTIRVATLRTHIAPSILIILENHGFEASCAISRYFIDLVAWRAAKTVSIFMVNDQMDSEDQEFFRGGGDMVLGLMQKIWENRLQTEKYIRSLRREDEVLHPSIVDKCRYHEHGTAEPCHG